MSNGRSNLNVNIFFVLISKAIIILIPNRHAVFFFPSDSGAHGEGKLVTTKDSSLVASKSPN